MMSWTADQVLEALGCDRPNGHFTGVHRWCLDSRTLQPGDGFLAFRGTHVNGHDYVADAARRDASVVIVEEIQDVAGVVQIQVDNVQDALWQLAGYVRQKRQRVTYIALTGSVGKSSTRGLLDTALSVQAPTYCSVGNLNNHLGMPLCLANMGLDQDYCFAVFELGMNHAGEIASLNRLLRPDLALVLNVQAVHIENFTSIEGIAAAKAEIFSGLAVDGHAFFPQGNFESILTEGVAARRHPILGDRAAYRWDEDTLVHPASAQCWYFPDKLRLQRFSDNVLAVMEILGVLFDHNPQMIQTALNSLGDWQPEAGRGQQSKLHLPDDRQITVIDDSYNASVASMLSLLSVMQQICAPRKILVIGDMRELGDYSHEAHAHVAHVAQAAAPDIICVVGKSFRPFLPQNTYKPKILWCDDAVLAAESLLPMLHHNDVVAIKASHSLALHKIIAYWQQPKKIA